MLPETHPLIEKVTEPLFANAERRMAARAFLGEKFDAAHPRVAEATARIEAAGRRKFPRLRKVLPWVLAVIVFAVAVTPQLCTIKMTQRLYNDLFSFSGIRYIKPSIPNSSGFTEEQRLLLDAPYDDEQTERLHLYDPGNPAYLAEYALRNLMWLDVALPPDFLDTANRIAPENAFFLYLAAQKIGRRILINKGTNGYEPQRLVKGVHIPYHPYLSGESEFDITDLVAFEESLKLIANASVISDLETYANPMYAARARLLPADTMADFTRVWLYTFYNSTRHNLSSSVGHLLIARAEQLSKNGRKEEFLALAAQREALIAHLGGNPDMTISGERTYFHFVMCTAKNFEIAATRLGFKEMAETYHNQGEVFQLEHDMFQSRQDDFPMGKISTLHYLRLAHVAIQVKSPPPISEADFEPMRRAEHELLGCLCILAVALSHLITALLFLFRFVATPMIRVLAKIMAGVIGMADWALVIGLGVVLPIMFYLLVTRHTPLAGRDYGPMYFNLTFPTVQFAALLLVLLIAPATVVRWRLSKRLAPFGFGDRFTVPLALAVMAMIVVWSLVALPVMERVVKADLLNDFSLACLAAPVVLCLCLLFANALRSILGRPAARLSQCTTAIAVLPAYPIAILILCALTPIYSAGEKRWLAQETLLRIDPEAPDLGAYEFKVAAQMRKEINAITGVN